MYKFKFYGFFVGLSIMIMTTCDALAFKAVNLFSYHIAASGLIFSFSHAISLVMTEVYGYYLAGRIVWVQLFCHVTFILLLTLFSSLPSPESSTTHELYFNLYHNLWKILFGSCFAMPLAYFTNDIIISKLKINLYGKKFIYRFLISSTFGSAVLVLISYPINFYDQYSIAHILKIAFNTWVLKVSTALFLLPFVGLLINILKKSEQIDHYDYGVSYNPLKVFSSENTGMNMYGK